MESPSIMHHNLFINIMLVSLTTGLGFISEQFAEQLRQLSLILTPIVQFCSIASFIIFLIINKETIKQFFKKTKKDESNN